MAEHIFRLQHVGPADDARTDGEESRLDGMLVQIVEEHGRVRAGAVVVGNTPGELVGAGRDVRGPGVSAASPPTIGLSVGHGSGRSNTSSVSGGGDVGNVGASNLLEPLLNLWRVGRRNNV